MDHLPTDIKRSTYHSLSVFLPSFASAQFASESVVCAATWQCLTVPFLLETKRRGNKSSVHLCSSDVTVQKPKHLADVAGKMLYPDSF